MPSAAASEIAIGVMITATALFDTISVRIVVSRKTQKITTVSGSVPSVGAIASTSSVIAPEFCKPAPTASMEKINASKRPSGEKASSASPRPTCSLPSSTAMVLWLPTRSMGSSKGIGSIRSS